MCVRAFCVYALEIHGFKAEASGFYPHLPILRHNRASFIEYCCCIAYIKVYIMYRSDCSSEILNV